MIKVREIPEAPRDEEPAGRETELLLPELIPRRTDPYYFPLPSSSRFSLVVHIGEFPGEAAFRCQPLLDAAAGANGLKNTGYLKLTSSVVILYLFFLVGFPTKN